MNSIRACQAESETVDLFNRSVDGQLDEICLKLDLPQENISAGATRAKRIRDIWDLAQKRGGATLAELEDIARAQQGMSEPLYWLYLSFSEMERKDIHCRTFFGDLTSRLRAKLGVPTRDLRYFDEGNSQDSEVWSPWSLRAMQQCQVLVCLYSKAFFGSRYCGRVWSAFLARLKAQQAASGYGRIAPLILPVFWTSPAENAGVLLPRVARDLEIDHAEFGAEYRELGLRFLVEHRERDDFRLAYESFLDSFSARLIHNVASWPLRADLEVLPLTQTKSLFYQAFGGTRPAEKGAQYAKFVYVAARKAEIEELRRPEAYDEEPDGWRPYHPLSQERLGVMSAQVASAEGMIPVGIPLNSDFLASVRSAEANGNIIMVLVDPWTIQLADYGKYIHEYDGVQFSRSTVLICWNEEDAETISARGNLSQTLETVFYRTSRASSPERFRNAIGTITQLRQELADALLRVRRQIVDETPHPMTARGQPFIRPQGLGPPPQSAAIQLPPARRAESGDPALFRQPRIEGPSGGTSL